jgi:hydrogenase nickel incorporation protein HypA/HybF
MQSVVDEVSERMRDERVTLVRLEVGALSGVAADALAFCFDVCARGTTLEGARLDVVTISGRARCHACGAEAALAGFAIPCACGSFDRELVAGGELRLVEVEVQ